MLQHKLKYRVKRHKEWFWTRSWWHQFCWRKQPSKRILRCNQSKGDLIFKCMHWFQSPFNGKGVSLPENKVFTNAVCWAFSGAWSLLHAGGWRIFQRISHFQRCPFLQRERAGQTLQLLEMELHKHTYPHTHWSGALKENKEQKPREVHLLGWPQCSVPGLERSFHPVQVLQLFKGEQSALFSRALRLQLANTLVVLLQNHRFHTAMWNAKAHSSVNWWVFTFSRQRAQQFI